MNLIITDSHRKARYIFDELEKKYNKDIIFRACNPSLKLVLEDRTEYRIIPMSKKSDIDRIRGLLPKTIIVDNTTNYDNELHRELVFFSAIRHIELTFEDIV